MEKHHKYPRTWHLPSSEKASSDDRRLVDDSQFVGKRVIASIKMDGENTSMYRDHIHARSLDSGSHPSRGWVKSMWAGIRHEIPIGWRVCGENLYGRHTIAYENLPSYFMAYSVWDQSNRCLPWEETIEWLDLLGLEHVPVFYDGIYSPELISAFPRIDPFGNDTEGFVVRLASGFGYDEFDRSVAKHVRSGFVIADQHWMHSKVVPNGISPSFGHPV